MFIQAGPAGKPGFGIFTHMETLKSPVVEFDGAILVVVVSLIFYFL